MIVPVQGEFIGGRNATHASATPRAIDLRCANAVEAEISPASMDAVLTDPPYFGNVQYAELMDFCYVWLRRLVGKDCPEFRDPSTRSPHELTYNESMRRGLSHFTEGLSSVFQKTATALKSGHPLVFTYHHNRLDAYLPVAVALLDSGLTCSASLPCPGEMGASIHINGTGSSIIDTVFVCRSTGSVPRRLITESASDIASLVSDDVEKLTSGGCRPSRGDIRCIIYGHLIRLAVWHLDRAHRRSTRH